MAFSDLVLGLAGQGDPRDKLAAAMAYQRNPADPMVQAAWRKASGQPDATPPVDASAGGKAVGSVPTAAPEAGKPGVPAGQQPPPPPPQPQAYTSPPDLVQLQVELTRRGEADASIDRGLGLVMGSFAQPANRQRIYDAGNAQAQSDIKIPDLMDKAQAASTQMVSDKSHSDLMASLPDLAKSLDVPLDQLRALPDAEIGKLVEASNVPSSLMKEYREYVANQKASGLEAVDLNTFRKTIGSSRVHYGLNLKYAPTGQTDSRGLPIYMSLQLADDGSDPRPAMFNGKPLAQPAKVVETADGIDLYTPDGFELIRHIDKNLQKAEYEKIMGGKQAENAVNLPSQEVHTNMTQQFITDALNNKDIRPEDYDNVAGNWTNLVAGTVANLADLKGTNDIYRTIQALNANNIGEQYALLLKGSGTISDYERKATAAFGLLANPQYMTGEQIKDALHDIYLGEMDLANARRKQAGITEPFVPENPLPHAYDGSRTKLPDDKYQYDADTGDLYQASNGRLRFIKNDKQPQQ